MSWMEQRATGSLLFHVTKNVIKMKKPILAIVGRPNTGKSTLFNALAGKRLAIVGPKPGVTRDRIMTEADWVGHDFVLIDTGGIETGSKDSLQDLMHQQVDVAIEMADVICFLTDISMGLSDIDFDIAQRLRKSGKPVICTVNKVDVPGDPPPEFYSFYELGFAETIPISASHKLGLTELLDSIVRHFPEPIRHELEDDNIPVAILGRPNVGKSSLANKLLGEERSIVSDIPGTTRDSLDSYVEYDDRTYRLIDTAGLRRKSKIDDSVEYVSTLRTRKALERSEIALIMIDAVEGIANQDTRIAGLAHQAAKASIFIVNKWDLMDQSVQYRKEYEQALRLRFHFMSYAPVIFLSALTGEGIDLLWQTIKEVHAAYHRRMPTSLLNDVVADAIIMHPAPQQKGRQLKIYYATMTGVAPPTILFFINDIKLLHFSYERYLENRLRDNFDFQGTPLILRWKGKAARNESKSVVTPE